MTRQNLKTKVEYGDFQTPLELSEIICQKLIALGVNPNVIIEPTCGVGNFIEAAANSFKLTSKIIGLEINLDYLQKIENKQQIVQDARIKVSDGNFFQFDWHSLLNNLDGEIFHITIFVMYSVTYPLQIIYE